MKCIIFSTLLCAVALEAKPYGLGGFSRNIGTGLGTELVGGGGLGSYNGLGTGVGLRGLSRGQSGYAQGAQFGGNQVDAGASGFGNQAYISQGADGFHDNGFHHKKVTSINQAEESSGHSSGGGQSYNMGAQAGGSFNNYLNGANNFGSQFGRGGASQQGYFL